MDDLVKLSAVSDSTFSYMDQGQSNSNFPIDSASLHPSIDNTSTGVKKEPISGKTGQPLANDPSENAEKEDSVSERDQILCLLSHFDREQLDQYEVFRRGAFPKSVIRMIMETVSGRPASQNAVIAMAGITKVYIGEIVEEALRYREEQRQAAELRSQMDLDANEESIDSTGRPEKSETSESTRKEPLKPSHIYEAVRRLSLAQFRPREVRL